MVVRIIDAVERYANALVARAGRAVAWLVLVNSLVIAYDVASRYLGGKATDWAYDIGWMLYAIGFMIGGAYTLQAEGHVRVDLFWQRFSERQRAMIDIMIWAVFILPMVCAMGLYGIGYAVDSWSIWERSAYSPWRPYIFPIKTMIPITFLLLFLQAISDIIRKTRIFLRGAHNGQ